MQKLFEYSDRLNSPYEGFVCTSSKDYLPIRSHWHYFMEIIDVLEGKIQIECDGTAYCLNPGDIILFHPRVIHSIDAANDSGFQYNVLKFDLNQLNRNSSFSIKLSNLLEMAQSKPETPIWLPREIIGKLPLHQLISECIYEMEIKDYGYDLIVQSKLTTLLLSIIRFWRKNGFNTDQAVVNAKPDSHSIFTITEYIDAHSSESLLVKELAEKCNMSYSYFAKNFHQFYGQSCKEYIEFIRISKAEDLLLFTHFDLNYISQETGFSDCSHLIKSFKKRKGITPKQYRKAARTS